MTAIYSGISKDELHTLTIYHQNCDCVVETTLCEKNSKYSKDKNGIDHYISYYKHTSYDKCLEKSKIFIKTFEEYSDNNRRILEKQIDNIINLNSNVIRENIDYQKRFEKSYNSEKMIMSGENQSYQIGIKTYDYNFSRDFFKIKYNGFKCLKFLNHFIDYGYQYDLSFGISIHSRNGKHNHDSYMYNYISNDKLRDRYPLSLYFLYKMKFFEN